MIIRAYLQITDLFLATQFIAGILSCILQFLLAMSFLAGGF